MALRKEAREGLIRMGLNPDRFVDGDEAMREMDKLFEQRAKERKAKEAKDATVSSVSKKKRV